MSAHVSFVSLQITRLTDRRTDGQTPLSWLIRASIPCSAVNEAETSETPGDTAQGNSHQLSLAVEAD